MADSGPGLQAELAFPQFASWEVGPALSVQCPLWVFFCPGEHCVLHQAARARPEEVLHLQEEELAEAPQLHLHELACLPSLVGMFPNWVLDGRGS